MWFVENLEQSKILNLKLNSFRKRTVEFNLSKEQHYLNTIISKNEILKRIVKNKIKGFKELKIVYYLCSKFQSLNYYNSSDDNIVPFILPSFLKLSKLLNCSHTFLKCVIKKYINLGLFKINKIKVVDQLNNSSLKNLVWKSTNKYVFELFINKESIIFNKNSNRINFSSQFFFVFKTNYCKYKLASEINASEFELFIKEQQLNNDKNLIYINNKLTDLKTKLNN